MCWAFPRPFTPLPGAQDQEWPRPRGSHDSWRRGATLATHTILSPPPPGAGFDSGGSRSCSAAFSLSSLSCNIRAAREMASAASSRCSGVLLPPNLAGARCCPRPSSSLRFRSRSARRRPGTLACVAPPDSAEQKTVRSDSTPKAPLPCPRIVISRRRSGSVIFFSVIPCKSLF